MCKPLTHQSPLLLTGVSCCRFYGFVRLKPCKESAELLRCLSCIQRSTFHKTIFTPAFSGLFTPQEVGTRRLLFTVLHYWRCCWLHDGPAKRSVSPICCPRQLIVCKILLLWNAISNQGLNLNLLFGAFTAAAQANLFLVMSCQAEAGDNQGDSCLHLLEASFVHPIVRGAGELINEMRW